MAHDTKDTAPGVPLALARSDFDDEVETIPFESAPTGRESLFELDRKAMLPFWGTGGKSSAAEDEDHAG